MKFLFHVIKVFLKCSYLFIFFIVHFCKRINLYLFLLKNVPQLIHFKILLLDLIIKLFDLGKQLNLQFFWLVLALRQCFHQFSNHVFILPNTICLALFGWLLCWDFFNHSFYAHSYLGSYIFNGDISWFSNGKVFGGNRAFDLVESSVHIELFLLVEKRHVVKGWISGKFIWNRLLIHR